MAGFSTSRLGVPIGTNKLAQGVRGGAERAESGRNREKLGQGGGWISAGKGTVLVAVTLANSSHIYHPQSLDPGPVDCAIYRAEEGPGRLKAPKRFPDAKTSPMGLSGCHIGSTSLPCKDYSTMYWSTSHVGRCGHELTLKKTHQAQAALLETSVRGKMEGLVQGLTPFHPLEVEFLEIPTCILEGIYSPNFMIVGLVVWAGH